MDEMTQALEELMLCEALSDSDRDVVERAIDDGYDALPNDERACLRRLLNQRAASSLPPLQRYRLRRAQMGGRRLPRHGGTVSQGQSTGTHYRH